MLFSSKKYGFYYFCGSRSILCLEVKVDNRIRRKANFSFTFICSTFIRFPYCMTIINHSCITRAIVIKFLSFSHKNLSFIFLLLMMKTFITSHVLLSIIYVFIHFFMFISTEKDLDDSTTPINSI